MDARHPRNVDPAGSRVVLPARIAVVWAKRGVLAGAALGAAYGSVFPILGNAVGAVLGCAAGTVLGVVIGQLLAALVRAGVDPDRRSWITVCRAVATGVLLLGGSIAAVLWQDPNTEWKQDKRSARSEDFCTARVQKSSEL